MISPVAGFSFPTYPFEIAVNQIFPSWSATNPCGPESAVFNGNSLNCPVFGSKRPSLLAIWPVYQRAPSGAAAGSWGREWGVGTSHSLIVTGTLPVPDAAMRSGGISRQATQTSRFIGYLLS